MSRVFPLLAEEFNCPISCLPASDWILKFARCSAKSNLNDSNSPSTWSQSGGRRSWCSARYQTKLGVSRWTMSKIAHSSVVPTPSFQARFIRQSLHKNDIFTLRWKWGQIWENTNPSLREGKNIAPSTTLLPARILKACLVLSKTWHSITSINNKIPHLKITRNVHNNKNNNLISVISFRFRFIAISVSGRQRTLCARGSIETLCTHVKFVVCLSQIKLIFYFRVNFVIRSKISGINTCVWSLQDELICSK